MSNPTVADVAFASSVRELGQEGEIPCVDPVCAEAGGVMEPEQDGDHKYFACSQCGYEGKYTKMPTSILSEDADGNCAIGVPAEIRKTASGFATDAMAKIDKEQGKVNLGLTIGKRLGL